MVGMAKGRKGSLFILIIVFAALGIGVVFITFMYGKVVYQSLFHPNQFEVKLYFAHPQVEALLCEKRWIIHVTELNNQASALIQELIKGPKGVGIKTIPSSTQLKRLTVKDGIATVDFSSELSRDHPGGTTAELLTIYSIVNSLILNFHEIKKVQLLIDGRQVETLVGHINCRYPLVARRDLMERER
jgi:hypothetical protein